MQSTQLEKRCKASFAYFNHFSSSIASKSKVIKSIMLTARNDVDLWSNDVVPYGTNEKIQADWLGFFGCGNRIRRNRYAIYTARAKALTPFG